MIFIKLSELFFSMFQNTYVSYHMAFISNNKKCLNNNSQSLELRRIIIEEIHINLIACIYDLPLYIPMHSG